MMPRYSLAALFVLISIACAESADESAAPDTGPAAFAQPEPLPEVDVSTLPRVDAQLGVPPRAAPPTGRTSAAHVVVDLEVRELTREIADGVTYTFWTFGGTVPGPMIRVRRGDYVELHLQNHPDNTMPHNIDLHAVTGPGGGAESTFAAPGHQTQFTFRALNAGAYVYHCATAPVGMHVANGMYGLIVVEPDAGPGLPPVDHEYYVMQGDFYTQGDYRQPGLQAFDMERAIDEDPAYVLFNGRDGALLGDGALAAQTGETVRIFFGDGGPNLTSSLHVIGEIFDRAWQEGGSSFSTNVQTTMVPAGGAAIVDFRVEVPGTYSLVDHSLFRAFNKGALGQIRVTGAPRPELFSGRESDEPYTGASPPPEHALAAVPSGDDAQRDRGAATFANICSACHQRDARGIPNVFPPLAQSDFLMADEDRSVRIVLSGLRGPVTVNGQRFDSAMPAFDNLSDREIADVLTYVRSSFGNHGDAVSEEQVARIRAGLAEAQ